MCMCRKTYRNIGMHYPYLTVTASRQYSGKITVAIWHLPQSWAHYCHNCVFLCFFSHFNQAPSNLQRSPLCSELQVKLYTVRSALLVLGLFSRATLWKTLRLKSPGSNKPIPYSWCTSTITLPVAGRQDSQWKYSADLTDNSSFSLFQSTKQQYFACLMKCAFCG